MLMQRFLGVAQTRNFYPKHVDSENKKNRCFVWKSVGNLTKMSKRGLPRIQWWRHVKAAILSQLVTTDDESLLAAFPLSTFYNLHEWTLLLSTLRALLVVLTRYEHLLCGKCCVLSSRND